MDAIKQLLANLSLKQKVSLAAALVAVVGGLWAFAHWSRERDFAPLYRELAAEDAGAVVARLKESAIEYRVGEGGGTILVPSARVAELRLMLAASGLPKTGRIGFELFDRTNFGVSDFAEQVNFRRALEGELERSIVGIAEVQSSRVHLTFPKDSVFLESRQPAKASVMLKLRPGATLRPANVVAIGHLIASAVEGLTPENVAMLDMHGNLLSRSSKDEESEGSAALLDFRRRVERDLLQKVTMTLEPLLGAEHFRAGVTVECDLTSGEQSEETFDPDRSVMTNAQRSEESTATAATGGQPGTPTNLPRPVNRPAAGGAGIQRRTENISYQTSRTVRHVKTPQGGIKRLSVAVLVDHRVRWTGSGEKAKRVVEPLPAENLKAIREVVTAATGALPARGDQVVVETLAFGATLDAPPAGPATPAQPAPLSADWLRQNWMVACLLGALAFGSVAGLAFVLWRRGSRKTAAAAQASVPTELASAPVAGELAAAEELAALEAGDEPAAPEEADPEVERQRMLDAEMKKLAISAPATLKAEALSKHLMQEANQHPKAVAQLLRTWMNEERA